VFATYQSIDVVAQAHRGAELARFDLIVCDEAHRTTGATLVEDDESAFVRVHDNNYLRSRRRLYMTATPRIYDDTSKAKAGEVNATIASMDDEASYGPEFHRLGFGDAVARDLLTDYKVLVLAVDETAVAKTFQMQLSADGELTLDDAAKIVGFASAGAALAALPLPAALGSGLAGIAASLIAGLVLAAHRAPA